MANFYTYFSDGTMTLTMICSITGCNKQDLYVLNNTSKYNNELTMRQYLQSLDLKGSKVPAGVSFKVPVGLTGGVNTKYSLSKNPTTLTTTDNNTDTKYNVHKLLSGRANSPQKFSGSGTNSLGGRASNYALTQNFNSYFYTLLDGSRVGATRYLPIYPNEIADTTSSNFNAVSLLGRSVDYQIYQGSSRSVSFTLNLHEELCSDYDEIRSLVAEIESACFPGYSGGAVQAPEIVFKISNHLSIRGILTSCTANWKAPIIDGRLVNCDLSVSVTETTGPYSMQSVRSSGGQRR